MVVKVVWGDACDDNAWTCIDDADMPPMVVETVGYLLRRRRNHYILSRSVGNNNGVEGRFLIPRGCIIDVQILEL